MPIEAEQLERTIAKLERPRPAARLAWQQTLELSALLREMAASILEQKAGYPRRIASRTGNRVTLLETEAIAYFMARDKLTDAGVEGREHAVDPSINTLEQTLAPARFLRIHRALLVTSTASARRTSRSAADLRPTQRRRTDPPAGST